jgi:hypothetical protein
MGRRGRLAVLAVALVVGPPVLVVGAGAAMSRADHERPAALIASRRGLASILGVLRRPQTKTDLDPAVIHGLNLGVFSLAGSAVPRLMRLAIDPPAVGRIYLVPVKPLTQEAIAKLPAPLRSRAKRRLALEGHGQRLALLDGTGGGCCDTVASIEAGRAWSSSGPSPNTVVLVVPDGVARVTIRVRRPVTAIVQNNVAVFVVVQPVEDLNMFKMTWYAGSGDVIKRFG